MSVAPAPKPTPRQPPAVEPRPRLGLIPGEPAGIGPELCVRALARDWPADLVVYGDPDDLRRAAAAIGVPLAANTRFHAVAMPVAAAFGQPDPRNAAAVIASLHDAAQACLDGRLDGIVTGPVHKAAINAGGIAYTGTTELLAAQTGCEVVMLLANPSMRVALATTHLPLRAVPDAITRDGLIRTTRLLETGLREQLGIAAPRIAMLGLNPHAGEAGHLGREEIDILIPALQALRADGIDVIGPLPADSAFLPHSLRQCDAVLAMYHDQGLPVLKHAGFDNAVNITLGLPYPRVAVDHGTALELAGSGRADPGSLYAAISVCAQMAAMRKRGASRPAVV